MKRALALIEATLIGGAMIAGIGLGCYNAGRAIWAWLG
ncbi:hypothetical protein C100_22410 [Sphingobium sp. C100]|jgi:hypothetical protein|nr:hypothetical protein C100_22410 [Sphingobium sp. C100]